MLNIFSVITGEIEVALSIVARKINVSWEFYSNYWQWSSYLLRIFQQLDVDLLFYVYITWYVSRRVHTVMMGTMHSFNYRKGVLFPLGNFMLSWMFTCFYLT
jgi:hypothetical protein